MCVSFKNRKKAIFANHNEIINNRKCWHTIKPFISEKSTSISKDQFLKKMK